MIEILVSLCAFVGKTWNTTVSETALRYTVFFWNDLFTWAVLMLAACVGWFVSTKVIDPEPKWAIRAAVGVMILIATAVCGFEAFHDWASAETPTYTLIRNLVRWF